MPGRISLTSNKNELEAAFPGIAIPEQFQPHFNIAPKGPVGVISNANPNFLDHMIWGMIPSWEKGVKMTSFLVNARSESIATRPTFRSSLSRRRCLIPADGYFEWLKIKGVKKKKVYYIYKKDRSPFAFAGIWDAWQSIDGSEVISFATITCEPNNLVRPIHHRMGVILDPAQYEKWLSPEEIPFEELLPLLKPFPSEKMNFHQVSNLADDKANNSADVIEPVEKQGVL